MTKNEFLEKLSGRLKILRQDEIDDILAEYSGYIDSKMEDGKTEVEAVADFGNVDELAKEILLAYKVSDNYVHQTKVGQFVDRVGEYCNMAVDYIVDFFRNIVKDNRDTATGSGIVEIVLSVFVALVLIALLKIPFYLLEWLGQGLIAIILGSYAADIMGFVWALFTNLCFLAVAVIIIIGMVKGGMGERFRSIGRQVGGAYGGQPHPPKPPKAPQPPRHHHSGPTGHTAPVTPPPVAPYVPVQRETQPQGEAAWQEPAPQGEAAWQEPAPGGEPTWQEPAPQQEQPGFTPPDFAPPPSYATQPLQSDRSLGRGIMGFLAIIAKIFGVLLASPLLFIALAGAVAVGTLICLIFQDILLVGPLIMAISGLSVVCSLLFIAFCLIFRRGKGAPGMLIQLVAGTVIFGFGVVFTVFEVMSYDFIDSPPPAYSLDATQEFTINLEGRTLSVNGNIKEVQQDSTLTGAGYVRIVAQYSSALITPQMNSYMEDFYDSEADMWYTAESGTQYVHFYTGHSDGEFMMTKRMWDLMLDCARSKTIYNLDQLLAPQLTVYVSPELYRNMNYQNGYLASFSLNKGNE